MVTGAVDGIRFGQSQVLDISQERVAYAGQHRVRSLARLLDDNVIAVVHNVRVIAGSANERVGTGATIENVVPAVPGDHVVQLIASGIEVRSPGQREGFHIVGQCIADAGDDGIYSFVRIFH